MSFLTLTINALEPPFLLPALTALTMNQEVTLMTCLLLVKNIGDGLLLGVKKNATCTAWKNGA
jgi:hypothetical protein